MADVRVLCLFTSLALASPGPTEEHPHLPPSHHVAPRTEGNVWVTAP